MIHSMTGFGRAALEFEGHCFDIEARSVNHRYLDVRVRVPRLLAALETELKTRAQERFSRGKIDISVSASETAAPQARVEVDLEAAGEYLRAAEELGKSSQVEGRLDVASLLALPGVSRFVEAELPGDALRSELLPTFDAALEAVLAMRVAEGKALERELLSRLERVAELADELESRAGAVGDSVRVRLRKRTEQLARETGLYDEARLHQEIVLAADRMDVTEELVRLRSHVEQFRSSIQSASPGEPLGRRLEFLLQELGREANTVGSKAADAPIAHSAVELKGELERLREQVQNVE